MEEPLTIGNLYGLGAVLLGEEVCPACGSEVLNGDSDWGIICADCGTKVLSTTAARTKVPRNWLIAYDENAGYDV